MRNVGSALDAARQAAKIAIDRSRVATNQTTDPQLEVYERLQPNAFHLMVQRYGADQVVKYIQTMEAKRLKSRGEAHA